MRISHGSVNRPVTTIMVFTFIVLFGIISWIKLPQELFPSINYPQITVVTNYQNASPEEIENLVTKIIEEAVGTVNGVKRIKSFSKEGVSLVVIDFAWNTKMDFAALSVREKIDLVKEKLPRECDDPVVMKYNPFELPIMNLAVTSEITPSVELREITRKYIKEAIEKVEGVANATITGGDIKEIVVEIDQARLLASQISIVSVVDNLKNANLNYPAGTIKESVYEYLIRTMGEYQSLEEIRDTPTALEIPEEQDELREKLLRGEKIEKERRLVYLRDIAMVEETIKERNSVARYNGKENISLVVRKQSGVNTLKVADAVRQELKKLKKEKLPPDVDIKISYDQSLFIKESIKNLRDAAIQGGILALFVLIFFLRDVLSSLAIALSIPISLMATFCLMFFAKINLNMMSLGGLALGVGMLVDNSIVVIENIFRHRQTDKDPKTASADGAHEVFPPILGSTLTTVAVFLPFGFVVGIAGQIFKQLSLTITFSLIISIAVAVSLIPVIISLGKKRTLASLTETQPQVRHHFSPFLAALMKQKWLIILIVTVLFIGSVNLLLVQERRFLPEFDQRQFVIKIDMPPGTRLKITDALVQKIEALLLDMPDIKDVSVNIGSSEESSEDETTFLKTLGTHQAQIMVNLKPLSRRQGYSRSTKEAIQYLKQEVEQLAGSKKAQIAYLAQETSLGQAMEEAAPVAVEISGPELNTLAEIASQLKREMQGISGLYSVKTSLIPPTPETKLQVMKDKASLHGLSVRDIAVTAQVALKGYVASQFKVKGEEKDIDIRVRLREKDRANLSNLRRLLIRSPLQTMVPLSEVAYLIKGTGPTEIQRVNLQRTIMVTANIINRPLNEIISDVNQSIARISQKIPQSRDYSLTIAGEQQQMQESFKSLAFALTLAIILVYMIMASEFESLWQPFIIMFTVPLSLIGVTAILMLTHTPLSVVAYLGIIMLGGIVVNNGIVLVDFINNLRSQGYGISEAAIEGASVRLRPILMTSLTTILGMLPLALGIGEGSELRAPLARTVIGGLFSSAFLTLVFIPAVYIIVNEFIEKAKASLAAVFAGRGQTTPLAQPSAVSFSDNLEEKEDESLSPYDISRPEKPEEIVSEEKSLPTEEIYEISETEPETGGSDDLSEAIEEEPPVEKTEQISESPQKEIPDKEKSEQEPPVPETGPPPEEKKPEPEPAEEKPEEPSLPEPVKEKKIEPEPVKEKPREPEPKLLEKEEKPKPEQKDLAVEEEKSNEPPLPGPEPAEEKKLEPEPDKEKPAEDITVQMNERQIDILEKLKSLKKITRTQYAKMYGISIPTAARDLKFLSDNNLIVGKGPLGPGRWYELEK